MKLESLSKIMSVVSHPPRLRLMYLLASMDRDLCVCELVDALDLPQYQVSRQLGKLREAGLVEGEKDGTWVYYSIKDDISDSEKDLLEILVKSLDQEEFKEDISAVKERLKERENGKCVVGYEERNN